MAERQIKKRKIKNDNFIPLEIIYEISKYIRNIKDFLHLTQINKYYYENLLINENKKVNEIISIILKEMDFNVTPSKSLPHYLFDKLESVAENSLAYKKELEMLTKFTNLKILHFSDLSEDYTFKYLPKLEELNIVGGQLKKDSFLNLKHIKKLLLHSCDINNSDLDNCLQNFTNLTELKIINCENHEKFTGKCLQKLNQLKNLNIMFSLIEDENLKNLTNLTKLNISNCDNIKGTCFKYLKNLEFLKAHGTNVKHLNELTKLKKLKISPISFDGETNTSFLKNMTNLEYLEIVVEECDDEDFKNLTKLKYLNLEGSGLSGKFINYLTSLEELQCCVSGIEDDSCLKNVKRLILENTPELTDSYLKQFKNLVKFKLNDIDNINGDCFLDLINLEKLDIAGTTKIKDEHLINLKKLKSLCISDSTTVTGECFKHFTQLKKLNAATSKVKEEYLECLTRLEKLELTLCPQIENGKFLLNMNGLKDLFIGEDISLLGREIEKLKKRIENGELLKNIELEELNEGDNNNEEEDIDDEDE
ncbi:hypothetical protein ABK040_003483 [Willaertia magna]